MIARLRSRATDEEGMTLIEIVISITLLGIIIGPVTGMILLGLLSSDGTRDRLADSVSAQLVSSYLVNDIQSAASVATSGSGCGQEAKLLLTMADATVVYYEVPNDGQTELHRASCGGSSSETLLVHYLGAGATAFQVLCDDDPSGCPTPTPTVVHVNIRAEKAGFVRNEGACESDATKCPYYQPFSFSIVASRRAT